MMESSDIRALPFAVNRRNAVSLTQQAVDGVIGAIATGYYRVGDRLPSIGEMARQLGVSHMVIRAMVRRLAQGGRVVARPGHGITVATSDTTFWHSHILLIYLTMRKLLASRQRPDMVYFADDYCARGALTALAHAGVRVPEEMQVATLAIRGHCPATPRELTRIEIDPAIHADLLSDLVRRALQGRRRIKRSTLLPCRFIAGETTAVPVKRRK